MSTSGLSARKLGRAHAVLTRAVDAGRIPGAAALVVRREEEAWVGVVGDADRAGTTLQRDAIFRISSLTKPITAVATLILVEEGLFRLDEPVDEFLPELADRRVLTSLAADLEDTVPAERPITVHDLLTFQMGLGLVLAYPGSYPIQNALDELQLGQGPPNPQIPPDPDEWMTRLGSLPLIHQPGADWMYNTGSDVLGVLIARATARPYGDVLRERVFEPLGMTDTAFHVPPDQLGRLTALYWSNPFADGGEVVYDAPDGQWSQPPAFPSGAGGLVSTIDDYAAFARMLMRNGRADDGTRLLSRPSIELMTTDRLPVGRTYSPLTNGFFDVNGYGFGVAMVTRRTGVLPVGTYGWDGGLGAAWRNDPREQMTTLLMAPSAWDSPDPPAYVQDFWTAAYSAIDD
ncbi:MAG TPA: serine hydrolase domain-containing protein [Mycobacteriales bacterium]|nr:serine hydrolase domain-containing protein [Mycobacteriales bacterium]